MAESRNGWCALTRTLERVFVAADIGLDICVRSGNANAVLSSTEPVLGRRFGTSRNIDVSRRILTFE